MGWVQDGWVAATRAFLKIVRGKVLELHVRQLRLPGYKWQRFFLPKTGTEAMRKMLNIPQSSRENWTAKPQQGLEGWKLQGSQIVLEEDGKHFAWKPVKVNIGAETPWAMMRILKDVTKYSHCPCHLECSLFISPAGLHGKLVRQTGQASIRASSICVSWGSNVKGVAQGHPIYSRQRQGYTWGPWQLLW